MTDSPESPPKSPPKSKFDNDPAESSNDELWVDRYLLPAVREFTLFPLLLVVIGHVVAFIAPALLFALRDRSFGAMLALFAMGVLTVQCVRFEVARHGRPDILSGILLATWLASGAAAWACDHYHLL
jgi:hypothetical protein